MLGIIWIGNQHNLLGRTKGAGVAFGVSCSVLRYDAWEFRRRHGTRSGL